MGDRGKKTEGENSQMAKNRSLTRDFAFFVREGEICCVGGMAFAVWRCESRSYTEFDMTFVFD